VGGHCISVDPWFFVQAAPDLTDLIHMARQVNDAQPDFVVSLAERALGGLAGKRIAVLGLAYKPNVDDLRESPAIEVAHQLVAGGAQVNAFEPYKTDAKIPGLTLVPTLDDAVRDVDAVLLLVAHKPFVSLAPAELAMLTSARVLIDTVNGWSGNEWVDSEFAIYRLGVGKRPVV
jgi:UDP-N-acetyl-D-mannosaminuronic acid dehydrogenase